MALIGMHFTKCHWYDGNYITNDWGKCPDLPFLCYNYSHLCLLKAKSTLLDVEGKWAIACHYILFITWDAVQLSKCRWVIWHKVFETLSTMLSISSQSLMVLTIICYFSKSSESAVAAEPDDKVSITLWLKAMVLCGWISDGWIYFPKSPSFSVFYHF